MLTPKEKAQAIYNRCKRFTSPRLTEQELDSHILEMGIFLIFLEIKDMLSDKEYNAEEAYWDEVEKEFKQLCK